ncbi:hypothetical protein V2G26_017536 [Clonostachys chloroleuca]
MGPVLCMAAISVAASYLLLKGNPRSKRVVPCQGRLWTEVRASKWETVLVCAMVRADLMITPAWDVSGHGGYIVWYYAFAPGQVIGVLEWSEEVQNDDKHW